MNKLIKALSLKTFNEYYDYVVNDSTNSALLSLIDRISTNHTFFYREKDHFELMLNKILPEITARLKSKNSRTLRIWCAGCATGEEPYTLGILLHDFFGLELPEWDAGILATDISTSALEKAKAGIYPVDRLRELPVNYVNRYFKKVDIERMSVNENIRKLILFKRLNLMNDVFPFKGKFDIIFCRNVMIYFDKETRDVLVNKFDNYMSEGGYFFVGHSESLDRKAIDLAYIQPAVYKKV